MQTSLYSVTIPVFIKGLTAMSNYFDKAHIHAQGKKYDAQVLLSSRLAPDQFSFVKQVQTACDTARAVVYRLNNEEIPPVSDTETTVEELRKRLDDTIVLLKEIPADRIDGHEDVRVRIKWFPGKYLSGFSYVTEYALANFYFHMTTAYAILRHNGIDLGKGDYMGGLSLQDDL